MEETITKRKKMNEQDALKIVKEWGQKSIENFAQEFQVAPNTVRSMVYEIRKVDETLCPRKPKKKRADVALAAVELLRNEDRITDMDN